MDQEDIDEMVKLYNKGLTQLEIARKFDIGVTQGSVSLRFKRGFKENIL